MRWGTETDWHDRQDPCVGEHAFFGAVASDFLNDVGAASENFYSRDDVRNNKAVSDTGSGFATITGLQAWI